MSRKRITEEEFINRIKWMRYDLSEMNFKNINTKVDIICPKHGKFSILPSNMLYRDEGCRECGVEKMRMAKSLTRQEFIKKAEKIYPDLYDYSLTVYKNNKTIIKVICKTCGKIFKVRPNNFLAGKFNHICFE